MFYKTLITPAITYSTEITVINNKQKEGLRCFEKKENKNNAWS